MDNKNKEGYRDDTAFYAIKENIKAENEKKKEYLRGYRKHKEKARRISEEIEELRLHEMAPGVVYSGMPSAHNQRDLSDYMAKYDTLMVKLIKERKAAVEEFEKVHQEIECMQDDREKNILTMRYLRGWKWEKIAREMGVEWAQVHRIHSRALSNFKLIKDDTQ